MKAVISLCLFMLLNMAGSEAYADIYKYIDSKGAVHFTNVPRQPEEKKPLLKKEQLSNAGYERIIMASSAEHKISPSVIKAVITVESNWNPRAISKKGALGLMQLMPSTADDMHVRNPFDPEQNINGGTKYLRYLLDRFRGDIRLALAAYNSGPSTVERSGGIPRIRETRNYVKNVLRISKKYNRSSNRIYKVTYNDGTVLFTNTPMQYQSLKLTSF